MSIKHPAVAGALVRVPHHLDAVAGAREDGAEAGEQRAMDVRRARADIPTDDEVVALAHEAVGDHGARCSAWLDGWEAGWRCGASGNLVDEPIYTVFRGLEFRFRGHRLALLESGGGLCDWGGLAEWTRGAGPGQSVPADGAVVARVNLDAEHNAIAGA